MRLEKSITQQPAQPSPAYFIDIPRYLVFLARFLTTEFDMSPQLAQRA
jgi:hypothetical protein